jgi:hypothetical protein
MRSESEVRRERGALAREILAAACEKVAEKHNVPELRQAAGTILDGVEYDFFMDAAYDAVQAALASQGEQHVVLPTGDDGQPMVLVSREFKSQADHDAETASAVANLLRNNSLGLSGSQPEMVAALLELAARQPVEKGWSGWATQYPGKVPVIRGAREIAELNHYPEEGQRLIFLAEQPAPH